MHNVVRVARILLGLPLLAFSVLYFTGGLDPLGQGHPPRAMAYWRVMVDTEYFLPLLKGTELVGGLLLILGQFVPFALVLLAPVTVNIVAYHAYLDPNPGAMGMAIAMALVHLFLFAAYGQAFEGVLRRVGTGKRSM